MTNKPPAGAHPITIHRVLYTPSCWGEGAIVSCHWHEAAQCHVDAIPLYDGLTLHYEDVQSLPLTVIEAIAQALPTRG